MVTAVFILAMLALYLAGYLVSVYSLAIYLDPDDLETGATGSAGTTSDRFFRKLADNPRLFRQLALLFKSFVLACVTILGGVAVSRFVTTGPALLPILLAVEFLLIWPLYIYLLEHLPRRHSRSILASAGTYHVWVLMIVHALFSPILALFSERLTGSSRRTELAEGEREELIERAIETLADETGIGEKIVAPEEREMISQIFLLDETAAREIMVPRLDIAGVDKQSGFREIRELIHKRGFSRYPVYDGSMDKIIGVLYAKDLLSRMPELGEQFSIEQYIRPVYFVPENKIIHDLLREFKTRRVHLAIVVDEFGGVSGLVTLEDILEEIVGDIQDEHDREEALYTPLADGRYCVDAGMLLEELQELLGVDHEKGDYDTVGGLIYDLVGSVPAQGEKVSWNNLEFVVESVKGQRILSLTAGRISETSESRPQ